jgi:hypothetical protein
MQLKIHGFSGEMQLKIQGFSGEMKDWERWSITFLPKSRLRG